MTEQILAFSIPLGAAQPGLSDGQLKNRTDEAERIVRATMPFAASLKEGELVRGLKSIDGLLWRTFSLEESQQMSFDFDSQGRRKKQSLSAAHRMHRELERLKEEAEGSIIRVGDIQRLASSLSKSGADHARDILENLPDHDQALWHLVNSKRGKRISISFQDRDIGISMPMFPSYFSEDCLRHIRFRVTSVTKKSAGVTSICALDDEGTRVDISSKNKLKSVTQLKRIPSKLGDTFDHWFCLYGAEYSNHTVEATVRVAVKMLDLSPNHLELVSINNLSELVSLTASIHSRIKP